MVYLTLVLKSGGSVLAPVRRFTRKAFQLEYLCCMPVREMTQITATITTNKSLNIQEQDSEQVWHEAHFLEVQGVCHLKRTIPPGAPRGYRDYTRSPYWCRCQSPHTAGEP